MQRKISVFGFEGMICDKEGPTKWEDALSPSNKTEFCYRIQNKEPRKNIILDSSMVEHSAVNRVVAGSSPARGARAKEESGAAVPKLKRIRLRGQAVKTSPFHGGNTGSIPVGVISVIAYADVAQLAEQLICNQQVIGSSPIIGFQP